TWWIFKEMVLRLTALRRLFVLSGIILAFINISNRSGDDENTKIGLGVIGVILVVIVLMLELKDKIIAKDELVAGREIQKALMPKSNPEIGGWDIWVYSKPANEICGDLIDHFKLTDNSHSIVIADVAGKGLNAALFTTKLQSAIRTLSFEYMDIRLITDKVNKIFYRESLKNIFATMIIAEISDSDGTISYINSGHIPPLILSGGNIKELEKGDPALGLLKTYGYSRKEVKLNTGEYFIAYSDGVTDAMNDAGEFFEKTRLFELLRIAGPQTAKVLGEYIISTIENYMQRTNPADDLSIIIFRKI
ncbi:MAG: serine/threonine-protein phosphatase, partial [Ignavibacteria bacterium]|nr:serine/threonine-protein phosphatase [Ignavibacteria bacterium]